MLIGNRYADNKLYRGIKHYDKIPLTSGDLHEYADTLQVKNALVMNKLLGSGILNEPSISISNTGVSLLSPSILLLDGDICLIQSDGEILKVDDISTSGISKGLLCVVGWYQHLTSTSTLRSYGGVANSVIANDLIDPDLNIQVSTRYQLRWDTILVDREIFNSEDLNIDIVIPSRDATGELSSGNISITTQSKIGDIRVAPKPAAMDYAVSDIYIIPILQYSYEDSKFSETRSVKSIKPEGSSSILNSSVEPVDDLEEGMIWYNPDTMKFKIYIEGKGFVPTTSDTTLVKYHTTVSLPEYKDRSNIVVPIGIDTSSMDILQVIYEGLVLTEGIHYSVSSDRSSITLIDFIAQAEDKLTFVVIKLVESSNINSITEEFMNHANTTGGTSQGHVSLSDTLSSSLDSRSGVAATPKLVYDATTIRDSVTNKLYRITVTNGVLGVSEVL